MAITLTNGSQTIYLPDDLNWSDEFAWSPVQQSKTYTTTGALLVEEATRQSGRPITLEGAVDRGWITRDVITQLRSWSSQPSTQLQLTLRGVTRTVTFDHERGALTGAPVYAWAEPSQASDDPYHITLRLLEL